MEKIKRVESIIGAVHYIGVNGTNRNEDRICETYVKISHLFYNIHVWNIVFYLVFFCRRIV